MAILKYIITVFDCFQDCFHAECVTYTCDLPSLHVEQHVVINVTMDVQMTTMAKYEASEDDDSARLLFYTALCSPELNYLSLCLRMPLK